MSTPVSTEDLNYIQETIKAASKDKFKYGVAITYVIVWALFNWDLIYFILFDKSIAELKIQYIKDQYLNYGFGCTIGYFIRNLIIAAFFTFIFPAVQIGLNYLSRGIYKIDSETEEIKLGAKIFEENKDLKQKLVKSVAQNKRWDDQADFITKEIDRIDDIKAEFEEKEKEYLRQIDELKEERIQKKLEEFRKNNHIPPTEDAPKK